MTGARTRPTIPGPPAQGRRPAEGAGRRTAATASAAVEARPATVRRRRSSGTVDRRLDRDARLRYSGGMHIAFLGFGLIAGSIARAVRAQPALDGWTMAAWSPSGDGPRGRGADGILERRRDVAGRRRRWVPTRRPRPRPRRTASTLIDELAGPWRAALAADARS